MNKNNALILAGMFTIMGCVSTLPTQKPTEGTIPKHIITGVIPVKEPPMNCEGMQYTIEDMLEKEKTYKRLFWQNQDTGETMCRWIKRGEAEGLIR